MTKVLFVIENGTHGLRPVRGYFQDEGPLPFIRDIEHQFLAGQASIVTILAMIAIARTHHLQTFVDYDGQELEWDAHFPFLANHIPFHF